MSHTESMWVCEDCGWQWPLKDAPYQNAECDACGGEMHRQQSREEAEGITGMHWDNLGSGGGQVES